MAITVDLHSHSRLNRSQRSKSSEAADRDFSGWTLFELKLNYWLLTLVVIFHDISQSRSITSMELGNRILIRIESALSAPESESSLWKTRTPWQSRTSHIKILPTVRKISKNYSKTTFKHCSPEIDQKRVEDISDTISVPEKKFEWIIPSHLKHLERPLSIIAL